MSKSTLIIYIALLSFLGISCVYLIHTIGDENQKQLEIHYTHAVSTYSKCLISIDPKMSAIEAEREAKKELEVFKNKRSIVKVDENLASLPLVVSLNKDKLTAEDLANVLHNKG